eukprot:TRINITY_DN2352_c0_g1_i2.p1 TRINITY_DN2352_c0_g1~~TRINITY_DN2352_c0_g1_i2.p1  ORF type:complete len:993 (+),score=221.18 TRINITY_DN2352_c0_g1_i2:230-3208(+)
MLPYKLILLTLCLSSLLCTITAYNGDDGSCPNNCFSQWQQGTCDGNGTCVCDQPALYKGVDCGTADDTGLDWDNMPCNNGGRFFPPVWVTGYRRFCLCPPGWTGIECSICTSDVACQGKFNSNSSCDSSMFIRENKSWNCTVDPSGLFEGSNPSMTFDCELPHGSTDGGYCKARFYDRDTGVPQIFNCEFTDCAVDIDQTMTQHITCKYSSCQCTSWCNSILQSLMPQINGTAELTCTNPGSCVFSQEFLDQLTPPLTLQCGAGECWNDVRLPPPLPTPQTTRPAIVIAVGSAILLFVAIAGICMYDYMLQSSPDGYHELPHIEATLSFENISCELGGRSGWASSLERAWATMTRNGDNKHATTRKTKGRVVLQNLSGTIEPGKITAIFGASGAGKTTFIDILAGRKNTGIVKGDVYVNNEPRNKAFKRISGYVTQDDVMLGTLTVREHLAYTAMLRLPCTMPYDAKMERVDQVMEELGIAHIAGSRIGTQTSRGISGGEKKRLAVATELLIDPSILFLDEPTSGLDSHTASSLIRTLSELAHGENRRTIIMSIHQPRSDIYKMLDTVMIMANSRMEYHGPADHAVSYFAQCGFPCPDHYNPADFLVDTVASPEWVEFSNNSFDKRVNSESNLNLTRPSVGNPGYASSSTEDIRSTEESPIMSRNSSFLDSDSVGTPPTLPFMLNVNRTDSVSASSSFEDLTALDNVSEYAATFSTQVWVLIRRTMLNYFRNPFLLRVQYLISILIGVMLGLLFWHVPNDFSHGGAQNRTGAFFFLTALLSFGSITSLDIFFSERLLFLRERATGCYRTSSYFLSKAISDMVPMRFIPPLLTGAICYYMIGFRPDLVHFVIFIVSLVLISMTSTAMCMAISAVTPAVNVGNLIAILLLFFFLLFSGFVINTTSLPSYLTWVPYTSLITYGFQILMINEFDGLTIIFDVRQGLDVPINGREFIADLGIDADRLDFNLQMLTGMFFGYLLLAYLLLRFCVTEKR